MEYTSELSIELRLNLFYKGMRNVKVDLIYNFDEPRKALFVKVYHNTLGICKGISGAQLL